MKDKEIVYNEAKFYQIGLFSLNNAATNLYFALMGYVSYYANSVIGFSVVLISMLLTAMNVFDGITDPLAGFLLDKTKGKFGKFRPFMLLGNGIMAISTLLLFGTLEYVPKALQIPYFILIYAAFVLGYTFQTVVGKSGQAVITNNPEKRPLSTYFDSVFIMAAYGGSVLLVANYLVPKYGGYTNIELYHEYMIWVIVISGLCTIGAIIGIWDKDKVENYKHYETQKVKIRDYFEILKNNKQICMLILAACTNKFAATVYGHATVGVMLYGILMQNYGVAGLIGVVTAIPTLFVVSAGIKVAQNMGQKKALVLFTYLGIAFQIMMIFVLLAPDVNTISFNIHKINGITIVFVVIYVLLNGCKSITNNMVVPMIADCSDYEEYRSGKFVPGLMGALFSFVDKIFAALGTAFVGLVMLVIGYNHRFPQVEDTLTPTIKWTTIFLYCVVPAAGWICSLIFMHFYKLDKKTMKKIAHTLGKRKGERNE